MRPAMFGVLCCLVGCQEPNTRVDAVTVQWMDWPAEVNAGQAFRTRLVVQGVCALNPRFRPGTHADLSAVTFEPFYVVDKDPIECVTTGSTLIALGSVDTAGIAPALAATVARTYEMRAASPTFVRSLSTSLPVATYGTVTVRPSGANASQRNAAGYATSMRDTLGCMRLRPGGLYDPAAALVLEDQSDTTSFGNTFVQGYIYDATAPVCGETRVFHLVARS
jgi:hypothetical protein